MLSSSFYEQIKTYVKNYYEFKLPETFDLFCSVVACPEYLRSTKIPSSLFPVNKFTVPLKYFFDSLSYHLRNGCESYLSIDTGIAATKFRSIIKSFLVMLSTTCNCAFYWKRRLRQYNTTFIHMHGRVPPFCIAFLRLEAMCASMATFIFFNRFCRPPRR